VRLALAVTLLLPVSHALSQDAVRPRPKIGLALSGGGAKGCAHVGVLEELERLQIPVDYITGTSMGAIVGGLYASGMPLADLRRLMVETNWDDLLDDRTGYRDIALRRKEERMQYPIELNAGLKGTRVVIPPGVESGQKLSLLLKQLLLPVAYERDFSRLPIPFKAVATDLATGKAVHLDRGRLADAIRASMSIPGVFTPVQWNDHLLIDGGLADNLPADLVRSMGADIVIAVDIGQQNLDHRKLGSLLSIIGQTLNFQTRNNVLAQLERADVVLTPDVQRFGTLEFESATSIIDAGRREALVHEARLRPYSVDDTQWAEFIARRRQPSLDEIVVEFFRLEGNQRVDARRILSHVTTKVGEPLDLARLDRDVRAIHAMGEFDRVDVVLTEDDGMTDRPRGVLLRIREKPWGPTYLLTRLEVSDALDGSAALSLGLGLTRRSLNRLGAELRFDGTIGTRQGAKLELYQPLDFHGAHFVSVSAQFDRELQSLFDGRQRVATYSVHEQRVTVDVGRELGTAGAIRAGVSTGRIRAGVRSGTDTLPTRRADTGDVHVSVQLDTTDHPFIPTRGWRASGVVSHAMTELGADTEYSQASARLLVSHTIGGMTYFAGGDGGSRLSGTIPIYDQFTLGGLLSLGGFATGQLRGDSFAVARAGAFRRLGTIAPIGRNVYAGGVVEAGNVWPNLDEARFEDVLAGVTLFVVVDSRIGPLYAGISTAEGQGVTPYLAVSHKF